ncbi:hypothetical protein BGZ58_003452 [Dissophora ornata]|nr:hypothetical protein BGZ58_003452 [Dissophora ornata]
MDTSVGSPYQKPAPRVWGVVAQTQEQHLDDYPTAAEAAKKIQEQHEHHQANGHTNTNGGNAGKRTTAPSNTNSGEPMAKTVSALSSGADNWDEADEDESVDFLNAEAIEFADGSVVVASAVAQPAEGQKDGEVPQTTPQSNQREERVVERGEVDFNRAWPNRHQPVTGPGLYQPSTDAASRFGSQDRSHQSLWQGVPHERRPSNERPSHHSNQRRESFGSRDGQGPPRRDSAGPKEPFTASRRDSGNRDDRRDSFNRTGSYNRERETYHYRDNEYSSDRRPSHDRPPYTSDRFPDRNQRDFQLLTRPKEAINDHLGPHDPLPASHNASQGYSHQHTPDSRGPYESIHPRDLENRAPGYAHMGPPGAIEYDRPAQVTEDQREAMKHAAEEARKRHEEQEKKFEEGKARAQAKAAELAKQADEAKIAKAKEEEAAKEAEQAKQKTEDEAARKSETQASTLDHTVTSPTSKAEALQTVRESGSPQGRLHFKHMTEDDKKEAIAGWQALPQRLVKEEADRISRVREERRLKTEEEQKTAAANLPSSVATGVSSVGPWRRSGNVVTVKNTSDAISKSDNISAKKDERPRETAKSAAANAHSHAALQEVRVEQLDKVMHRIEESLQGRKNSLQTADATSVKKPSEGVKTTEPVPAETSTMEAVGVVSSGDTAVDPSKPLVTLSGKPAVKERTRDGKAGRAEIARGDSPSSWRKAKSAATEEKSPLSTPETKNGMEAASSEPSADNIQSERRMDDGSSKAASKAIGHGKYPAKLSGVKGSAKVSDISKIHARLSLQAAGERGLDLEVRSINEREDNTKKPTQTLLSKTGGKSADVVTHKATKRNSLLTSATATIFPSNVEKAAKNRGSMSFMVDSEIDSHPEDASKVIDATISKEAQFSQESVQSKEAPSQWEDEKIALSHAEPSSIKETHVNDSIKKAWDTTHTMDTQLEPAGPPKVEDGGRYHPGQPAPSSGTNVAQGTALRPMYMMSSSAPGVVNSMNQHMWNTPMSVESSSQAGATMAPFPMVMPYYQGYPVGGPPLYYMYPRGPMPPQLAQFPGGVIPPPGSVPVSPRDGLGGSSASQGSPDVSSAVPVDLKSDATNSGTLNGSASFLGPHHWLPRFSAAGDAPPQQPGVAGASFLATVPVSQQANMIAAANINRAPQSRPYAHHQQHQPRLQNSAPASLDSSFQERSSSPTSTDGWSSNTTIGSASTMATSPSNSGGRFHTQGAAGSPSWGAPNGRMNPNGPGGVTGPYGSYQQAPQHGHAGSGHRGGRGGFSGGYSYREFRPRGGHMNQAHHYGTMQVGAGYGYGHANMNGQSHGGSGSGASSTTGSVDQQHPLQHQQQGQPHGRAVTHDNNIAFAPPYSHRSPHMHSATASAGGEIQF